MMAAHSLNIVRVQSEEEIAQVVSLHKEMFPDNLSGDIGHKFIQEYFRKIVQMLPDYQQSPQCQQ